MFGKVGLLTVLLSALAASPALAVTVTNQDSHDHTLTIDRGATETQKALPAGQSLNVDCPDKCGFRDEVFGFSRLAGGPAKLVMDKDAELHFVGGHGDMLMSDGTT